ncbi:MAG TPA: hypothetical protein VLH38_02205 [Patescibacteria group bacterium]|nr:hypothetical protein [Patescibacteria group bacterium]
MKNRLLILLGLITTLLVGYVGVVKALPAGLNQYEGYFHHHVVYYGTFVLPQKYNGLAIPYSVNSANEFINFILNDLNRGSTQERVGAAFIIQTMIGTSRNLPPSGAQINEWQARVRSADSKGLVTWNMGWSYSVNSFYQENEHDDAFFNDSGSDTVIAFRDSSHKIIYAIKHRCANPVGNVQPLDKGQDFSITGRSTVSKATAIPGSKVTFTHYLKDKGPDDATTAWKTHNVNSGGIIQTGTQSLNSGREVNVSSEVYTIPLNAVPGTKYCRYISFSPATDSGGTDNGPTVCVTVIADFDLHPSVTSSTDVADQGSQITFTYVIANSKPGTSTSVDCNIVGNQRGPGYTPLPVQDLARTSDPGFAAPPTGCPRTFPGNASTIVGTETITVGAIPPGDSICRSLVVNPKSPDSTPRTSQERCVLIAAKPYVKVYGGDVSVGNGLSVGGTCTPVASAGVVSWNLGGGSAFAGAGAQDATYALNTISNFATAQASTGVAAPSGLAFANSTVSAADIAAGTYGGSLGFVPCIPDYYGTPTGVALPGGNVGALGSNMYTANGTVTMGGNLGAGVRAQVFVNGDVYINNDITYPGGGWSVNTVPLFELVVRGNIYVSSGVGRLDGIYIAQKDTGGARGAIYTCATGASILAPTAPNFYNLCNKKLTINGSFTADQIHLLRTSGTEANGTTDNPTSGNSSAAEQFNFNPSLWIAQPIMTNAPTANQYDAITSLPPVL